MAIGECRIAFSDGIFCHEIGLVPVAGWAGAEAAQIGVVSGPSAVPTHYGRQG